MLDQSVSGGETMHLSWHMSLHVTEMLPTLVLCLRFGDVTDFVTSFCDVSNSMPLLELVISRDHPN